MSDRLLASLSAQRIIVLRALNLGDLLCSTPAFRALSRRYPAAEITLIGLPWAHDLVGRSPYLDRLLISPGFPNLPEVPYEPDRTEAFFEKCRQDEYDLAIQLHGSGRTTNSLVAALGARAAVGFGAHDDERVTATAPWYEDENEVHRCLRLMAVLGADTSDTAIDFPISAEEDRRANVLLSSLWSTGGPTVALHSGAKDTRRRWPEERFAELGDALGIHFGARIVLTGSPDDRRRGQTIRRLMRVPSLDLTGQTDLGTFAAVIAHADLLVTNDTGASHLAAATRTPSVVLFGFARPERWAPLDRSLHSVIDAVTFAGKTADPATALSELPLEPVLAVCRQKLDRMRNAHSIFLTLAPTSNLERVCAD